MVFVSCDRVIVLFVVVFVVSCDCVIVLLLMFVLLLLFISFRCVIISMWTPGFSK